jgi:hypothetical protein
MPGREAAAAVDPIRRARVRRDIWTLKRLLLGCAGRDWNYLRLPSILAKPFKHTGMTKGIKEKSLALERS